MNPIARRERLIVQEVGEEILVYDLDRHRAHCLNRTAALVWKHSDGKRPVDELAAILGRELSAPVTPDVVHLAVRQLEASHLIDSAGAVSRPRVSRRAVARRLGLIGTLSVLLPAVTSIVSPTPAMAATGDCEGGLTPNGACCTTPGERCSNGTCVADVTC
jgi:hypothetical protein